MKVFLKSMRERHLKRRKKPNPDRPIATWVQDDIFLDKTLGKSLTIILRTVGCRWAYESGGCTMCSYLMDSSPIEISVENLINQFNSALGKFKEQIDKNPEGFSVKLFTSGSFLDDFEVPKEAREYILKKIGELGVKEVAMESRPEYITDENLETIRKYLSCNVEIGVGIESLNEKIRNVSIHKGVSREEIVKAIETAKKYSVGIKAYLLIKPPFITEKEAIIDSINSANQCIELGCSRISYCPSTIHKGTLVETLWKKDQYRPPFLWSILEILKEVKGQNPDKLIMCDTSGIPTKRGAHNTLDCKCNYKIKDALTEFTLTQNLEILNINCECKKHWEEFIEFEENNIVPLGNM
ncbi:MAG: archaeosine synthase beta-subunit [Methanothermococcus sp.]|jgi:hypothetical protein|uniref:archaeosine biosynthesis radical SAM protein RaSEA n=1 Tax=Methanothermococcus TaxID=155862 RepID=UPI00036CD4A8|nr:MULTISPECIES: archaeosine biosynthesis radical SAM protein RaSEA [Methanothermococcus]MDK2789950.1 archaeosine synthase beta-subunit [Methanothermococcus sp.]MDK2987851.1 archaeosine synthase beta-subunit [Methanothermococcus sp.]